MVGGIIVLLGTLLLIQLNILAFFKFYDELKKRVNNLINSLKKGS